MKLPRRSFLHLTAGAAALATTSRFASGPSPAIEGFQRGLQQLGYIEGQNLVLIYRWALGKKDRLVNLASELLQLKVDIFASNTTEAIIAIRTLDKTVPIVMTSVADPVGVGLVARFARPGGYTTGVTLFSTELAGKRLELLKEIVPRLSRIAILAERDHPPTATFVSETQATAQALRLALQTFEVDPEEIADAFRSISNERPDGLIVQQTNSFNVHIRQIADLAISHRLPTVQQRREFVQAGGLLAYGPNLFALGERAAWYVDRIHKGMKPADLPVEQPTKFELTVNLKTANALGLTISPTLLARADEVIE